MKKIDYRTEIEKIRHQYLKGKITLDEAKAIVNPMLNKMNVIGEKIAKEHGMRFHKLTFGYVFR